MRATARAILVTDAGCRDHLPFPGHPERPIRLEAAIEGAADAGLAPITPAVSEAEVLAALGRVHAPAFPRRLADACRGGPGVFDSPDNPISEGTYRAAWRAVGACLSAADAIATGRADTAWVPVRPPGHHARHDQAMGFCFFNNVAVLAESLLGRGIGPLAIVDFDLHHGNGTQEHFWRRGDVYYLSLHQYPQFPGSGGADEVGEGRGRGTTRNLPLAAGSDDRVFVEALAVGLDDLRRTLSPQAWLVSAGFDAHVDDPLGDLQVTEAGFGRVGELLADAVGGAPVVAVLEGGYELKALRASVKSFMAGLTGTAAP